MDRLLDATHRVEQVHFWFRGLRAFVTSLLRDRRPSMPTPRILDCGCGTGANLTLLKGHGRAFGFDTSTRGVQCARRGGERRIAQASIIHIPFGADLFDLVTAFDVLYSLPEDQEMAAVAEMYRVLRPGGTLMVNVAALGILRGNHSLFGAEVRRSTRRRLRRVLTGAGFEIDRLTYTNFTLFPLMLAVRAAQRAIGLSTPEEAGIDLAVPVAPVNWLLSTLLQYEARALRVMDMPIGSSLLCVARKPERLSVPQPDRPPTPGDGPARA